MFKIYKIITSLLVVLLISGLVITPSTISANPRVVQSTEYVTVFSGGQFDSDADAGQLIYVVHDNFPVVQLNYSGGTYCLSGNSTSCTSFGIDDAFELDINSQTVLVEESRAQQIGPFYFDDSTLQYGVNEIKVRIIDLVGPNYGGSPLYLLRYDPGGLSTAIQVNSITIEPDIHDPTAKVNGVQLTHFMHDRFVLEIVVENTSDFEVAQSIPIQEYVKSYPEDEYQPTTVRYVPVFLQPREIKIVTLTLSKHWNWTGLQFNEDCNDISRIREQILNDFDEAAFDIATEKSKNVNTLLNAYFDIQEFVEIYNSVLEAEPGRLFKYTFTPNQGLPVHVVESNDVHISFTYSKGLSYMIGLGFKGYSMSFSGKTLKSFFKKQWVNFARSFGLQLVTTDASCEALKVATDPDPSYQNDVQVLPYDLSIINTYDEVIKQYATDQFTFLSLLNALNVVSNRFAAAQVEGDHYWMERHAKRGSEIATDLAYALYYWDQSATALLSEMDVSELTSDDVQEIHQELASNGIPQESQTLASQMGVSEDIIQGARYLFSELAANNETIPDMSLPSRNLSIVSLAVNVWRSELQRSNTSLDVFSPVTSVALVGQSGNNDWYTSEVQVTLNASDTGGSGLSNTQWSLDAGRTWNTYSSTFTLQEGIHDLMVRSKDNAGNVEFPPVRQTIKVDYTPPQTTALANGPLDINNIFRDNILVTIASEDNLSGVHHIEVSNDNGVNWQTHITDTVVIDVNGNGVTQHYFLAEDEAGNREDTRDTGPITINRYAVFGNSNAVAVEVDRSTSILLDGAVHSNGLAKFTYNTDLTIDGPLTTQSGVNSTGNTSLSIPTPTNGVNVDMLNYPKAYFTQNADVVHNGNFTLYDTSSIISGTMYVQGDLTIYGTTVAGDGVVVVDGNIYDYSTEWNVESNDPGTGVVLYSSGNIELYGTSNYAVGMMYAPNGTITIHSTDLDMNGSLVANRVFFDGATSGVVTYDAAFESGTYTLPLTVANVTPGIAVIPSDNGELYDSMEPNVYFGRAYGVTKVEQSTQYPSEGSKSLKVTTNGSYGHFTRWIGGQDWSHCPMYEVHVVNPNDSRARVAMVATRSGGWHQTGAQQVPPQSAAILTYDLSAVSGMHNVTSFGFIVDSDPAKELYFDNFRRICPDPDEINVIPSTEGTLYESFEGTSSGFGRAYGVTQLNLSDEYASDGSQSLKVTTNGGYGHFTRWLGGQNWTGIDYVDVHVVNSSDYRARVAMALTRSGGWHQTGAQEVPARSAVILRYDLRSISGMHNVTSYGFIVDTDPAKDLYFDNIRRIPTGAGSSSQETQEELTEHLYLPLIQR